MIRGVGRVLGGARAADACGVVAPSVTQVPQVYSTMWFSSSRVQLEYCNVYILLMHILQLRQDALQRTPVS